MNVRYYYDKNIMTKVHGKRYAYKFDFQGLAAATQPAATDPSAYKYQSDFFMSSYHAGNLFIHFIHSIGIKSVVYTIGSIFPSPSSYWTSPSANLYSNIAAGHTMPSHATHMTSHLTSYPHYAWPLKTETPSMNNSTTSWLRWMKWHRKEFKSHKTQSEGHSSSQH